MDKRQVEMGTIKALAMWCPMMGLSGQRALKMLLRMIYIWTTNGVDDVARLKPLGHLVADTIQKKSEAAKTELKRENGT